MNQSNNLKPISACLCQSNLVYTEIKYIELIVLNFPIWTIIINCLQLISSLNVLKPILVRLLWLQNFFYVVYLNNAQLQILNKSVKYKINFRIKKNYIYSITNQFTHIGCCKKTLQDNLYTVIHYSNSWLIFGCLNNFVMNEIKISNCYEIN